MHRNVPTLTLFPQADIRAFKADLAGADASLEDLQGKSAHEKAKKAVVLLREARRRQEAAQTLATPGQKRKAPASTSEEPPKRPKRRQLTLMEVCQKDKKLLGLKCEQIYFQVMK